jgi:hypothetical protein
MHALVHAADVQDRDGGVWVMATLFGLYPFLLKLYADGGYDARGFRAGVKRVMAKLSIEIVKRPGAAKGFVVLPKRWTPDRVRGRALLRLAQPQPQAGQGLGMQEPESPRLPTLGLDPPHAAKAM